MYEQPAFSDTQKGVLTLPGPLISPGQPRQGRPCWSGPAPAPFAPCWGHLRPPRLQGVRWGSWASLTAHPGAHRSGRLQGQNPSEPATVWPYAGTDPPSVWERDISVRFTSQDMARLNDTYVGVHPLNLIIYTLSNRTATVSELCKSQRHCITSLNNFKWLLI